MGFFLQVVVFMFGNMYSRVILHVFVSLTVVQVCVQVLKEYCLQVSY